MLLDYSCKAHLRLKVLSNWDCILHDCEFIAIELFLPSNVNLIIVSFYRPPNMNIVDFNKSLNIFLTDLVQYKKKKRAILVGDFNIDLLKVDNHAGTNEFYNSMISYVFYQQLLDLLE